MSDVLPVPAPSEIPSMDATVALAALPMVRYRLALRPLRPLALPAFGRGAILRGGFGLAFRRLVCHDLSLNCRACPLRAACPYPEVFEPSPPAGAGRLSNFADLPRPFVVDQPVDERATFAAGERLEFGLSVVGRIARHAPYFVAAFQSLAETGLGPRRTPFALESVVALDAQGAHQPIYREGSPRVWPSAPQVTAADLMQAHDGQRQHLHLRFLTPVDVRDAGRNVREPRFGPLARRLRDRLSALAAFFGSGPLAFDFKALGSLADEVRLVEARTRDVSVRRTSARTHQRHDVGGFVGEARYEGAALGALMPLVRVGEVLHVGRHAAFGNGRIQVLP
jgi:hypothetical protein